MSAFQSYAGAYEFDGDAFSWRCYATARVYDIRKTEHGPPAAPQGRKWVTPEHQDREQRVSCLVDASVEEFSQILLRVEALGQIALRTRAPARNALAAA